MPSLPLLKSIEKLLWKIWAEKKLGWKKIGPKKYWSDATVNVSSSFVNNYKNLAAITNNIHAHHPNLKIAIYVFVIISNLSNLSKKDALLWYSFISGSFLVFCPTVHCHKKNLAHFNPKTTLQYINYQFSHPNNNCLNSSDGRAPNFGLGGRGFNPQLRQIFQLSNNFYFCWG